jgi:H/ACA ribonucleoprotein complex subunit 4
MEVSAERSKYLARFLGSGKESRFGEIVLRDELSDPKYGHSPNQRPLPIYLKYGFIALDKPQGPTSHEVVAWVRKILKIEKAGHSGTLDPMVSGVLPIGLGSATKAISALLLGPKEYVALSRLHDSVPDNILTDVLKEFTGRIFQKPPQRSSVKRATRAREIYEMELVQKFGNLLLLRVFCEAGTYIRKLIYDIGEVLQVGATMIELRRTKVCYIKEDGLVKLHDVFEAQSQFNESGVETRLRLVIRPVEEALAFLRKITIRDTAVDSICHGAQLAVPGVISFSKGLEKGEIVCLMSGKGEIVAIAESQMDESELQNAERGILAITRRVIMDAGTYPKMWKTKSGEAPTEELRESIVKQSLFDGIQREAE